MSNCLSHDSLDLPEQIRTPIYKALPSVGYTYFRINRIKKICFLFPVTCSKALCLLFSIIALLGCADIPDDLREEADKMSEKCKSIYNQETDFCYDGEVYGKCNGMKYNPTTHVCQGGVASFAKCNGTQYNPLEQGCCISELFSLANQRCQNNVVETICGTGNNYHNPVTQFCNGNEVLNLCSSEVYNPTNQRCQNNAVETICGSEWYDARNTYLRCQSNVVETKCGTGWYNSATQYCSSDGVKEYYGKLTDSRDGKTYKITKIGTQIWMAENLNYIDRAYNSKCAGIGTLVDAGSVCDNYGRLYDWSTAMGIATSYNSTFYTAPAKHQGICPSGWHIPNDYEWDELMTAVGGSSTAGKHLKAKEGWNSYSGIVNEDTYGFAALPGGDGYSVGNFGSVGDFGNWWSASEDNANYAYNRRMSYNYEDAYWNPTSKAYLYSVRCLQD